MGLVLRSLVPIRILIWLIVTLRICSENNDHFAFNHIYARATAAHRHNDPLGLSHLCGNFAIIKFCIVFLFNRVTFQAFHLIVTSAQNRAPNSETAKSIKRLRIILVSV
jgi:hypothetical protein